MLCCPYVFPALLYPSSLPHENRFDLRHQGCLHFLATWAFKRDLLLSLCCKTNGLNTVPVVYDSFILERAIASIIWLLGNFVCGATLKCRTVKLARISFSTYEADELLFILFASLENWELVSAHRSLERLVHQLQATSQNSISAKFAT
eukprot:6177420-Pleurochrysis_carterae.AAC.4